MKLKQQADCQRRESREWFFFKEVEAGNVSLLELELARATKASMVLLQAVGAAEVEAGVAGVDGDDDDGDDGGDDDEGNCMVDVCGRMRARR